MNIISSLGGNVAKFMLGSYFKFYPLLFSNLDKIELINGFGVIAIYGVMGLIVSIIIFKNKDIVY